MLKEIIIEAVKNIKNSEEKIKSAADSLRSLKLSQISSSMVENELIKKISEEKVDGKIGAVDGSLLYDQSHGIDLVSGKSAGTIFTYENGKLVKADYVDFMTFPAYAIEIGLDEREVIPFKSLFRLKLEAECALEMLNREKELRVLMLDGSIIPLGADKPPEDSKIFKEYKKVVEMYKKLFTLATEKGVKLIGVTKDSRSTRLLEILKPFININSCDTIFLSHLLNKGERTGAFTLTSEPKKHPIIKDFLEWQDKLFAYYIKASEFDRPLRIEILGNSFDETAKIIYSLSKINDRYAYPAVLIEADLKALVSENYLKIAKKTLEREVGILTLPLRRNSRPFRRAKN